MVVLSRQNACIPLWQRLAFGGSPVPHKVPVTESLQGPIPSSPIFLPSNL